MLVFGLTVLAALLYNIFGYPLRRLRSAQISLWAVLLLFIPLGPLVMFIICVVGVGGPIPTPLGVGWPLALPFVADVLARYPVPPEREYSPLVV
jgi:hypothetical protein